MNPNFNIVVHVVVLHDLDRVVSVGTVIDTGSIGDRTVAVRAPAEVVSNVVADTALFGNEPLVLQELVADIVAGELRTLDDVGKGNARRANANYVYDVDSCCRLLDGAIVASLA